MDQETGVVTAVAVGTANITAKITVCGHEFTEMVTVTVSNETAVTSHGVQYSVNHITADGPTVVEDGAMLTATLTAVSGYALPETITVTMNGTVATAGYTYNRETGTVTVANVTGDVVITTAGVEVMEPVVKYTVIFNTNGSSTTATTKTPDGPSSVVHTAKDGRMDAKVTVSSSAVENADDIVTLPMPVVSATTVMNTAPRITVDMPAGTTAKVKIAMKNVTADTVAVLVKANSSQEIIKTSMATESGVAVTLSEGDTIKIIDNSKNFVDVPSTFWSANAVARRYRELHIPLDVVVQDWKTWVGDLWGDKHLDKERFPNVRAMKEQMDQLHVHTLVSVWPNMNPGGEDHKEFADAGLLLHDYSTYNAFDPKGRDLYWKQVSRELYPSFDGWWCDSTEPFTSPDWCGEKKLPEGERYRLVGGEHETYLDPAVANCYALAHAKGIWEHQPEKPVVNLTRSGWAGIQQYGAILWAGDTAATWQELRREIAKAMSISICGIPYWTVDAGAFFTGGTACWRKWKGDPDAAPVWFWHGDYDKGVHDPAYQELYTRWLQFACFLPIFRSHGTDTPREVWNFEEPYRSAIEKTIRLRYRLMPYLKDMARRVTEEHFTMVRSLMFDFLEEPESADVDDEYLFGSDLLVCPVTEPMAQTTVRRCWLPKGADWYDFATARYYPGGQTVEVPVTIENIPVFVRAGATLELQTDLQYAAEDRPVLRAEYPRK